MTRHGKTTKYKTRCAKTKENMRHKNGKPSEYKTSYGKTREYKARYGRKKRV